MVCLHFMCKLNRFSMTHIYLKTKETEKNIIHCFLVNEFFFHCKRSELKKITSFWCLCRKKVCAAWKMHSNFIVFQLYEWLQSDVFGRRMNLILLFINGRSTLPILNCCCYYPSTNECAVQEAVKEEKKSFFIYNVANNNRHDNNSAVMLFSMFCCPKMVENP